MDRVSGEQGLCVLDPTLLSNTWRAGRDACGQGQVGHSAEGHAGPALPVNTASTLAAAWASMKSTGAQLALALQLILQGDVILSSGAADCVAAPAAAHAEVLDQTML